MESGPTGTTEETGLTGETGTTGPTGSVEGTGPTGLFFPPAEPEPDILSLDDVLSAQEILLAKEASDKSLLDSIGGQSVQAFKPKLVEWVTKGKPAAYPIMVLSIQPPAKCSDGEVRNLPDYITFCSGKSIEEHVGLLQAKLVGMSVSFANIGGNVTIVMA